MQFRKFVPLVLCAALLGIGTHSFAQEWPKSPVRVIVPFAPASTPDFVARAVGERLGVRFGKPMVVENKPGAAGNIGTDVIAKAAPDGQTIGVSIAGPLAVNALLFRKMPYDATRDLEFVTIAATQPAVLVVANKLTVSDTQGLIGLLQKNPGKYSFASVGAGSISHLAMEAMSARTGADLVHAAFAGSGAAALAVITGEVDMALLPASAVMPHIKAGKMKGLAVAAAKRSALLPELPTLAEAGVDDLRADAWIGFIVPAKTPAAIVKRLHDEIAAILAEPALREKLKLQYMDVVANSPAEFRDVVAADIARWKPVIVKHNIKLD